MYVHRKDNTLHYAEYHFLIFLTYLFRIFVCIVKKFLVIPLLLLYLSAASGIMIHLHYCGNELADWKLYAHADSCCGDDCEDSEKQNEEDCCNDKILSYKIDKDQYFQKTAKPSFSIAIDWDGIPFYSPEDYHVNSYFLFQKENCNSGAPPGLRTEIPLYKQHVSFIYYG
jgi:hypothetical protein